MARPGFILVLLFVLCFTLATWLQPRWAAREEALGQSGEVLALLLGDSRKLLANEFFAKADTYFHGGVYPSIFDTDPRNDENHMAEEAGNPGGGHEDVVEGAETGDNSQPRDWIERFGRHFYPTEHVHLKDGAEREMLPWLRFSAEMDPQQVQTYTVTAYWLGRRLGKIDEAEQFLYQGLQANPGSPELLYELGRLYYESRKDLARARNLWLAANRRWHEVEEPKEKPNTLMLEQILGGLALVAEHEGHLEQAIRYLNELKSLSPSPEGVQKRIDELEARDSGVHP